MISQTHSSSGFPKFPSIPPNSTLGQVLGVVETCLVTFPDNFPISLINRGVKLADADETDFNIEFAHWLSLEFQHSKLVGQFTIPHQYPEPRQKNRGSTRTVDLAVRAADGKRILALEGKRLYDPNDRQYVSGNTGGITRFKREQHAKELPFACMVGYLQIENGPFWHQKINDWIGNEIAKGSDLIWMNSETLSNPIFTSVNLVCCDSIHPRQTQPPIQLKHFWVDFQPEESILCEI